MIRYLKTFIVAGKTSSFSLTGSTLGLTQSAVSTQIQRLEDDLNCRLFERLGKSVVLSARGKELLPIAQEILRLYGSLKGQPEGTETSGTIEIGAISTVQLGLLPDALHFFKMRFPHVEVNVIPGTSVSLLSLIDARDLEIAVMIKPTLKLTKDLLWTTLLRESYVAIAPNNTKEVSLKDLLHNHPFIRYNRRSYGGQIVDKFLARARLQVNATMELDEPAVILQMVKRGLGVSIIPYELTAIEARDELRILPLDGKNLFREIGILQREKTLARSVVQALITSLVESTALRAGPV